MRVSQSLTELQYSPNGHAIILKELSVSHTCTYGMVHFLIGKLFAALLRTPCYGLSFGHEFLERTALICGY